MKSRNSRHGITLLFVVSMIVLFLLMGTAFIVVSGNFLRSAKQRAKQNVYQIDSDALLERAFYDLVREPDLSDANSPLRGHSLLGDMYGYGFSAHVATAAVNDSQQFITLKLDFQNSGRSMIDESPYQPPNVPSLAGLVLTFTNGPALGMSTRIVDHQVSGSGGSAVHTLIVQPDWGDTDFDFASVPNLVGKRVVVNGRPFAGTGAGNFDPSKPSDRPALDITALQPNQSGRSRAELLGQTGSGYLSRGTASQSPNPASTNESYDTFDFQNMFLAGINPDGSVLTPSFHRAELINEFPVRSDFRAFRPSSPNEDFGIVVDNDNNGQPDGIWIDIGLPAQATREGTFFKPLVSYTVVDLDGRINVNVHGNPYDPGRQMTEIQLLGQPDPNTSNGSRNSLMHRGAGYGPPEISLQPLLGAAAPNMLARYGPDGLPGEAQVRDGWSTYKLFGYPDASSSGSVPGTVAGTFGTVMDVHGRFAIGYPHDIRDIADGQFPIGLPVANLSESMLSSEVIDSAYEMSFAGDTMSGPDDRGFDSPFTPQELEGVFRRHDPDSSLLAHRLWSLGSEAFDQSITARNSITTASFEVPTTIENLPVKLAQILAATGLVESDIRNQIELMLPPEVIRGLPMNVNRPFGDGIDNNGNGIVDELGETNSVTHPSGTDFSFGDDLMVRANFARHLYVVTLLSTERDDRNRDGAIDDGDWFDFNDDGSIDDQDRIDYRKTIAQWAINVVDFRDRDATMSPFEVDLDPWDGWDVDGNISTNDQQAGSLRHLLWGSERPELLISETFVSHDRRTQDLKIDPTMKNVEDGDDDLDSHLVPNVSAFFELYNPWVMNDANQYRPAELYDANLDGLDLQKKSPSGSPVWRLLVTETDEADLDPDDATNNPTTTTVPPTVRETTVVRRIYFTRPEVDSGPEVYFPDPSLSVRSVPPGVYAVVGSAGVQSGAEFVTYFGRKAIPEALKTEELATTRQISLDPTNAKLKISSWNFQTNDMDVEIREVINIPIGRNDTGTKRNLGVSDPLRGYTGLSDGGVDIKISTVADGQKFTVDSPTPETDFAFDQPVDQKQDQQHYDKYLANDGLQPAYRTVHLQRLANPSQAFEPTTNPYRTIDSSSLDLVVFNGVEPADDPNNTPLDIARFGTFERQSGLTEDGDPAPNGQDETNGRQRLLFKNDRLGHQHPDPDDWKTIDEDNHVYKHNLVESFGGLNRAYIDANQEPELPFAWLCWNNRPFASQLELVNVPFTSSYWLTRLFNAAIADRDVYSPPVKTDADTEAKNYTAQFPYLLNFYSDELEDGTPAASLHRVFDYLEVPSRFVGTESYVNPNTFAGDQHGLSYALSVPFDTLSNYRYPGKLNINTVLDERVWNGLMRSYAFESGDPLTYRDWEKSRNGEGLLLATRLKFANPYRSPLSANWVPSNKLMMKHAANCGLFRPGTDSEPLFDYSPAVKELYNNDDRAAYFKYDRRQRLGNLVTGRSSVFAIWITIGYFESSADGSLRDAGIGGHEVGAASGKVHRPRAFYIFDRSIPVAFEPGKNHNVDRAILVRSRIE